jgi:hypothetical protein
MLKHACNLKELYLDGAQISSLYTQSQEDDAMLNTDLENRDSYLWKHCPVLAKVSMIGATFNMYSEKLRPFTQDMLAKLVRFHPTIEYLKNDLTDDNIAKLQKERPGIVLVNSKE